MAKFIDLTGERFGQWTVTSYHGVINGSTMWKCRCSCGYEDLVTSGNLRQGKSTQCVKCRGKVSEVVNRKHGHATRKKGITPEYRSWSHMIGRCLTPTDEAYAEYGGRWITVYAPWVDSFETFFAYVGKRPSPKHSLERINTNGNYEPGNVIWATPTDQARNRRSNQIVTIDGVSGVLPHVCEQLGLDYNFIRDRTNRRTKSKIEAQDAADLNRSL